MPPFSLFSSVLSVQFTNFSGSGSDVLALDSVTTSEFIAYDRNSDRKYLPLPQVCYRFTECEPVIRTGGRPVGHTVISVRYVPL